MIDHQIPEKLKGKVFFVGGCVRDMIMGKTPKDYDFVVVGSSEEEMISLKFEKVGADFPVFLHPETGDEYALARREKKTGIGYLGFESEFGPDVTLEEDLFRRDISINSMAFEEEFDNPGSFLVHDFFGGKDDIQSKILRHTSAAFTEDPVRVLRIARFRARMGVDWKVAPETVALISQMSKKGVLAELQSERVWKEMSRALMEPFPRLFFDTLLECDALHVLFPEVYKLLTALEARRWHPEGNAYEHSQLVLTQAAALNMDLETRVACLVHDFGKGLTRFEHLPKHYGHEVSGVPVAKNFCERLTMPTKTVERACKVTLQHMKMHQLDILKPSTIVDMFDSMNALNDPTVVTMLHNVGIADHRGRLGSENEEIGSLSKVMIFFEAYSSVKFANVFPNGEKNVQKIKDGLHRARVQKVKESRNV